MNSGMRILRNQILPKFAGIREVYAHLSCSLEDLGFDGEMPAVWMILEAAPRRLQITLVMPYRNPFLDSQDLLATIAE